MCPFSSLSSRGEDYRVRIPRKICFGLMGPFRRVNALVRLENACPYWRAGRKRGEESVPFRGREEEKKGRKEGEDAVYWRFADIKWREKEEEDSWTLEKPCPGTDK